LIAAQTKTANDFSLGVVQRQSSTENDHTADRLSYDRILGRAERCGRTECGLSIRGALVARL